MLKLLRYYSTLLPECIFLLLWLGIQCFLFTDTFTDFKENPKFASTNALTGSGVAVAKACAAVINFNAAVLVGSMCRIGLAWLKQIPYIAFILPVDRYLQLHRMSSLSIITFSLIHTIAHYVNYTKIPTSWASLAFLTGPGVTGHILWTLLLLIATTSFLKGIKRWRFEVFWYVHYLSFAFLLVLSFHGAFCFVKRDSAPECPGAKTWKWLIGPVSFFILELFIKTLRSRRFTFISKVIIHQVDVVEVQVKKPSFIFKPGQYVQLKCPEVSLLQWHPFTITSAPEEGFISLHIRIVGDWTRKFAMRLGAKIDGKSNKISSYEAPEQLPDILIDGPYGSVSENYDKFEIAICIGAGIGQTPFSSILKSMWYSLTHPYHSLKLKKVLFIQISREIQSLSWFLDVLKALEGQNKDKEFLELNCYLTSKLNTGQSLFLYLLNEKLGLDPVTGLETKTNYGRPNFDLLFQKWQDRFKAVLPFSTDQKETVRPRKIPNYPSEVKQLELLAIQAAENSNLLLALQLIDEAIEKCPEELRASVYNNKAQILRLQGDIAGALILLDSVISLLSIEANKCDFLLRLASAQRAWIHFRAGRTDAAFKDFETASKLGCLESRKMAVRCNPYAAMCNQFMQEILESTFYSK